MHWVALTRLTAAFEGDAPLLASWLSLAPYDFLMRARSGLPALIGAFAEAAPANDLVAKLRARGYGAVVCQSADVPGANRQIHVREFQFSTDNLSGLDDAARPFDIRLSQVVALIRATSIVASESNTTTQTSKFALGRALATGGLMMKKKVEVASSATSEDRESVLYLFTRSQPEPLLFRETHLHYQGLGAALKPVSSQNFLTLVQLLRAGAPRALYDERFLKQKRKVGISAVVAVGKDTSISSSNASDNDLAAYLLVLALEEGQL